MNMSLKTFFPLKIPAKGRSGSGKIKSIGVLCSGGDAPGMNAAIRAVVRFGLAHGIEIHGISKGYTGLLEGSIKQMSLRSVANIIQRGGTILKTSRCKAFFSRKTRAEAVHILNRSKIDALVVIGGDGSYAGAYLMGKENKYPVIGVPGTIDNDVFGSDYTIGFDTAVNTALDAIDKIRDTASSHDRVFLIEVMGRTSADIATRVAISGGAEFVMTSDDATSFSKLCQALKRSQNSGKMSSIIIVTEGDEPGHSDRIAKELKTQMGVDPRVAVLGHVQRGGSPTAQDRTMASLMGAYAVKALMEGHHGCAVSEVKGNLALVPFQQVVGKHKKVNEDLLKLAQVLAS